jgi:hypothetical protein
VLVAPLIATIGDACNEFLPLRWAPSTPERFYRRAYSSRQACAQHASIAHGTPNVQFGFASYASCFASAATLSSVATIPYRPNISGVFQPCISIITV